MDGRFAEALPAEHFDFPPYVSNGSRFPDMDNRRPLWPVITAVLVGMPLLYVASFGPACWVSSRFASECLLVVYRPLIDAGTLRIGQPRFYRTPSQKFLRWYADLGSEKFSNFYTDRIYWTIFRQG